MNEASPLNSTAAESRRSSDQPPLRAPERDDAILDMMELFFFAYRDFVKDADRLLETYKFGRAHHRVLHFVNRRPGLAIAALLDILKITKQSLNRVLKQLLHGGFVEARAGANDRRQRLLYPSPKGAAQIAFLLKPTRIEQVAQTSFGGGVMPQKSTDFYPKLLSGLTIYKLD